MTRQDYDTETLYLDKLRTVLEGARRIPEGRTKEKRCYETAIDPHHRSHIMYTAWELGLTDRSPFGGTTNGYTSLDVADEAYRCGVYYLKCLDLNPERGGVVRVKLSRKTIVEKLGKKSINMAEFVSAAVKRRSSPDLVPSLSEVALAEFPGSDRVQTWTGAEPPEFLLDLIEIIGKYSTNDIYFCDEVYEFRKKHVGPGSLVLGERYYPERADHRAFFKDMEPLRSVCGATLQDILCPRSYSFYRSKPFANVFPKRGKNLVHAGALPTRIPSIIGVGDIGGFSASNMGSWASLVSMALALHRRADRGLDPIVLDVEGWLVETTLMEIVLTYLKESVFAEALDGEETYFTMGGYLGVGANMTLTCVSYQYVLDRTLSLEVAPYADYRFGIGGDDFYIIIVHLKARAMWDTVLEILGKYAGFIRGVTCSDIPQSPGRSRMEMMFCKKRILVEVSRGRAHWETRVCSETTFPVMKHLLESPPLTDQEAWIEEYLKGIVTTGKAIDHSNPLGFMLELWREVHESPLELRMLRTVRTVGNIPGTTMREGLTFSTGLIKHLGKAPRYISTGWVRSSLREQLDYMQLRKWARVVQDPTGVRVWLTPGEAHEAEAKSRYSFVVDPVYKRSAVWWECVGILKEIRENIG